MPRMRILTPAEQASFDTPPVFTSVERQRFFHIPESLEALLATLRTPVNQVGFVVTLGYFRATKRFFARQFHPEDVDYVTGQLGYLPGLITLDSYAKSVQSRHRKLILDYLGFRAFDTQVRQELAPEIRTLVRSHLRPKTILLRLQDTLIDILLTVVQNVLNTCHREHKEHYYAARLEQRQSVHTLVDCVDQRAFSPLAQIEAIAFCPALSDAEKVRRIQAVPSQGAAQRRAAQAHLEQVRAYARAAADAGYYTVLAAKSVKLQNRIADIVKHLAWEGDSSAPLAVAIRHYQDKQGVVSHTAPLAFLTDEEQQAVVEGTGTFRVSLYKALLFVKMAEAIKAGTLNLKHSYKYRSLEDYLIPKPAWDANRDAYLQRADLTGAADWHRTMAMWAMTLDDQYHQTNRRLLAGHNPHLRVRKDGTFHVSTPKADTEDAEPLRALFPKQRYISLVEVLSTINRLTHFLEAFEHWQVKYTRAKPPERTFLAGVIGYGRFIGIPKIARISTGINAWDWSTRSIGTLPRTTCRRPMTVSSASWTSSSCQRFTADSRACCTPPATARNSKSPWSLCRPPIPTSTLASAKRSAPTPSSTSATSCGITR
jgi:hypothetical protein